MRTMIQCIHENNYRNLTIPSKGREMQILCDSLGISNTAKTENKIGTVHNDERMIAENPHPMITPYGVVYKNSNEIRQIYDGMNFPYYQYEDTPITLLLSSEKRFEYL